MKLLQAIASWFAVIATLFLCCLAIGTLERIANRLENPPELICDDAACQKCNPCSCAKDKLDGPSYCPCPAGFCRCYGNPCKCALTSKGCGAPHCRCAEHPAQPTPARELHFPLDPDAPLRPMAEPVLKSVVVAEPLDPMPGPEFD